MPSSSSLASSSRLWAEEEDEEEDEEEERSLRLLAGSSKRCSEPRIHHSLHDHKEDLRKRLSYTTHKLEMVETEFDSTRQYLETELRRAQEELEKFTEKLRRIQSSYAALQRINQDLEDKMHSSERLSSHLEQHNRGGGATAMCHSNYPDAVPTAVIATVLAKPEPGGSCPATRAASPQPPGGGGGGGFLPAAAGSSGDHLNRRAACKTSDLYRSDTALYCPPERWQNTERRQSADLRPHNQNSTDSNPDEEAYRAESFSHHEPPPSSSFSRHEEFGAGSLPASSSYSSFSLASDEKGGVGVGLAGRGSPYGFSERHSEAEGSLYSGFQDGGDVFRGRAPERRKQEKTPAAYGGEEDGRESECSVFLSLSSKGKDFGSAESLRLGSLEACSLQHYPSPRPSVRPRPSSSSALGVGPALPKKSSPRYQKFGSTGLTRKDSLTKAQLYGTLLN
ncbi:Brain-enriched guanylate kinase-associated protein [Liparis tanakae]|uniref:Brain-enriched guanylate kinase-associated protein n=1 Tax=Liparis tanakae TaxID=230148 RepID=A0A4Z2F5A8_9TELE|nr:Brain-enriched guanylate kinase-associated protein [Liparis tanakae]